MDVFFGASPVSHSRLGLVVAKHGHDIVHRNRVKRRLREIGRRLVLPGLDAEGRKVDVLLRARRSAYAVRYAQLEREVLEAVGALCSEE